MKHLIWATIILVRSLVLGVIYRLGCSLLRDIYLEFIKGNRERPWTRRKDPHIHTDSNRPSKTPPPPRAQPTSKISIPPYKLTSSHDIIWLPSLIYLRKPSVVIRRGTAEKMMAMLMEVLPYEGGALEISWRLHLDHCSNQFTNTWNYFSKSTMNWKKLLRWISKAQCGGMILHYRKNCRCA